MLNFRKFKVALNPMYSVEGNHKQNCTLKMFSLLHVLPPVGTAEKLQNTKSSRLEPETNIKERKNNTNERRLTYFWASPGLIKTSTSIK